MLNYHHVTLTQAHQQLTQLCTQVGTQPDMVIITPTPGPEVVLMAKAELNSLLETARLEPRCRPIRSNHSDNH